MFNAAMIYRSGDCIGFGFGVARAVVRKWCALLVPYFATIASVVRILIVRYCMCSPPQFTLHPLARDRFFFFLVSQSVACVCSGIVRDVKSWTTDGLVDSVDKLKVPRRGYHEPRTQRATDVAFFFAAPRVVHGNVSQLFLLRFGVAVVYV